MLLTIKKHERSWMFEDSKGRIVSFKKCTLGKYEGKLFMCVYKEIANPGCAEYSMDYLLEVTKEISYYSVSNLRMLEEIEVGEEKYCYTDVFFNMSRETNFLIDWNERQFRGYTFDMSWNGWACPYFEKEVADAIIEEFSNDETKMFYDEVEDTYYCEEINNFYQKEIIAEPTTINTPCGRKKVYSFAYTGWAWSERR